MKRLLTHRGRVCGARHFGRGTVDSGVPRVRRTVRVRAAEIPMTDPTYGQRGDAVVAGVQMLYVESVK
jgi:hypothetical protein